MVPMVSTSTPFITYSDIKVEETDLFDDAWGFRSEFADVLMMLGEVDPSPGERMAEQLIELIRELH
jgi:hypothetical protein